MAKVELEGKLTSGFPAMTATVQVHKRSPRDGFPKWIVKAITVAALNYEMREALDLFKDWIQGLLQRSLGNGGATQEKSTAYIRAISRQSSARRPCDSGSRARRRIGPVDIQRDHLMKLAPALKYQSPISPSTMLTIWSERTWKS